MEREHNRVHIRAKSDQVRGHQAEAGEEANDIEFVVANALVFGSGDLAKFE